MVPSLCGLSLSGLASKLDAIVLGAVTSVVALCRNCGAVVFGVSNMVVDGVAGPS